LTQSVIILTSVSSHSSLSIKASPFTRHEAFSRATPVLRDPDPCPPPPVNISFLLFGSRGIVQFGTNFTKYEAFYLFGRTSVVETRQIVNILTICTTQQSKTKNKQKQTLEPGVSVLIPFKRAKCMSSYMRFSCYFLKNKETNKLRGLCPRANYTGRAIASCRRS
jgi:hypothetical protein